MSFDHLEGYQINLATKKDTSNLIKMLKQIAQWMKDNDIDQWRYLLDGGDDEEIEQAVCNQETYIVLKDYEMVATFTLASKQTEWDRAIWGKDNSSKLLYLHRLAIIPTYMNKGIGRGILSWIQNNRDQEYLRLDCVAENIKLNNFYKDNRFDLVGITDGHSKYQMCLTK
nr:GNAT family N-acetyltransferase [Paenibacillus bovis]